MLTVFLSVENFIILLKREQFNSFLISDFMIINPGAGDLTPDEFNTYRDFLGKPFCHYINNETPQNPL